MKGSDNSLMKVTKIKHSIGEQIETVLAYGKYRNFTIYCEKYIRKFEKEGDLNIIV